MQLGRKIWDTKGEIIDNNVNNIPIRADGYELKQKGIVLDIG